MMAEVSETCGEILMIALRFYSVSIDIRKLKMMAVWYQTMDNGRWADMFYTERLKLYCVMLREQHGQRWDT